MSENRSNVLIALGANLPVADNAPERTLISAVSEMAGLGLTPRAVSRFFSTPCFPPGAGPDYVNAVVQVVTSLAAIDVLCALHRIEERHGRNRQTRWGMRTLDLDLLAYDDQILPDAAVQQGWMSLPSKEQKQIAPEQLILPHPRLQDRAFVLVPLADIAPDWVHPMLGKTVEQLRNALPEDEIDSIRPM